MAPAIAKTIGRRTSSVGLELQKPSPSPATTDSSQGEAARAAKKVKTIKLKGPKKVVAPVGSMEQESSTAARPQRARRPPATFDQDDRMHIDSEPMLKPAKPAKSAKSAKPAPPTVPSSSSSVLSSAPPSPASNSDGSREESPFQDPVDTSADYGDFALYYTTGLDATEQTEVPSKKRKRTSSGSRLTVAGQAKTEGAKKSTKPVASQRSNAGAKATTMPSAPAEKPGHLPAQNLPPHHARAPPLNHPQQPPHMTRPPPVQRQKQLHHHHHGPSPYPGHPPPPGPHMQQASAPQLPPAPVIRFIEVPHDPPPVVPDTIAIMIDKLQSLSATLTQFGGVPAVAVTPGPESKVLPNQRPQSAGKHDQLDRILDIFDSGDDESEKSEAPLTPVGGVVPEVKDFNHVLPNPGTADLPLCFGIQFIQNALKSWAQQRMTHQIMAQWNDEQSRGFFLPQNGKGRGRPKKFEAPPGGPPPVIEMNLTDTPEGVAIRKFQLILDSGCLQVNTVLPIELARALRLLYMQIDNLINQGRTETKGNWYCMSYGAQIAAHNARLKQFKEAEARRQQELALLQQQHQQQVMAQMGLNPRTTPMTQEEAQRHHAMELERRRSAQHAQQQPYISQQHLHPLQLPSQQPPPANQHGGSPPLTGPPGTPDMPDGSVSVDANGLPHKNHFDKIKMYMPGFLPRSGQSMKFSFAPHSDEAVRAFGSESFPVDGPAGPQMPNRGPMMEGRRTHSSTPSYQPVVGDMPMPDAGRSRSRSVSNTKEDAIDLTSSDGPQPESFSTAAAARPTSSNANIGGFRPINGPAQYIPKSPYSRRNSVSAQQVLNGVEVAAHRPSAVGAPPGNRHNRGSAGSFPHPGAVVVDQ